MLEPSVYDTLYGRLPDALKVLLAWLSKRAFASRRAGGYRSGCNQRRARP